MLLILCSLITIHHHLLPHHLHYLLPQHLHHLLLHLLIIILPTTLPKEKNNCTEHKYSCQLSKVVVIVRPYCSPDASGAKYEQYCQQKLMLHIPFRHVEELLGDSDTYSTAYAIFCSLAMFLLHWKTIIIHRLEQQDQHPEEEDQDDENITEVGKAGSKLLQF